MTARYVEQSFTTNCTTKVTRDFFHVDRYDKDILNVTDELNVAVFNLSARASEAGSQIDYEALFEK